MDELLEINLGIENEPPSTYIFENMFPEEKNLYQLFGENRDVFAWTYTTWPRLEIYMHRLSVEEVKRPIKQGPKGIHPDLGSKVEVEVDKHIKKRIS